MKRIIGIFLAFLMLFSIISNVNLYFLVSAADDDSLTVDVTEQTAVKRGYEYYKAWYIANFGNWAEIVFGFDSPSKSLVEKYRTDINYKLPLIEWRILTFNMDRILMHSNEEKAYVEAMLFNLLYDEDAQNVAITALSDIADTTEAFSDFIKYEGCSEWSKLIGALDDIDKLTVLDKDKLKALQEVGSSLTNLGKGLEVLGESASAIENFSTLFEYFEKVSKVGAVAGKYEAISHVLADMADHTDNEAYESALRNFAIYTSDIMDSETAQRMYGEELATREFFSDALSFLFDAAAKKNAAVAGIAAGAAVGKFLANTLTGTDDEYNQIDELTVYNDFEKLLKNEVDRLVDALVDGGNTAGARFNAAYAMLKNVMKVEIDSYRDYIDIKYNGGMLNQLFSGANNNTYHNICSWLECTEESLEELFSDDELNANNAYEEAVKKYLPEQEEYIGSIKRPDILEHEHEAQENAKEGSDTFYYMINDQKVLRKDMEIYGCFDLTGGQINMNGHKITVYGDAYIRGGTFNNTGILDVKGKIIQIGGTVNLSGNSYFYVAGDYEQTGGSIYISGGKLTVGGDHLINTGTDYYGSTNKITDSGEEIVNGDYIANSISFARFESGKLTVGGNAEIIDYRESSGTSNFTFEFTGTDDLVLRNISGNMKIDNASVRNITFANRVHAYTLCGGDMTVTPQNLYFSGKPENDLIINGDAGISGDTDLDSHDLTVNGNLTQTGGQFNVKNANLTVTGKMLQNEGNFMLYENALASVAGDYEQTGGSIYIYGGKLTVGGDHLINTGTYYYGSTNQITDSGEEIVNGDYIANSISFARFESGKLTVGGNAEIIDYRESSGTSNFTFEFTGTDDLVLRNISGNMKIDNASVRNITFANRVHAYALRGGDMMVTSQNLYFAGKPENDLIINGDAVISGDTDLDSHDLTVNGNLTQTGGTIIVNGGQLDIVGDYALNNYASLNMSNAEDRVNIGGNMSVNSSLSSTLTNGILSIKGDFTQNGNASRNNFKASGNHVTYLNGSQLQRISFDSYPDSSFNNVVLFQYEENYVFSPATCWSNLTVYCDHLNTEIRDKVDVTCLLDGYTGDTYCCDCGIKLEEGEVIRASGHTYVVDPAQAATCTQDGKTAGRHCSVCKTVFKAQETIPATGHTGTWNVVKTPTCSEEGEEEIICTVCGQNDTRAIAKLSHTEEIIPAVPASCTSTGLTEGKKCSVCQTVTVNQEVVPALDHDWSDWTEIAAPTCTTPGTESRSCSRCAATETREISVSGRHTPSTAIRENEVAASCKAAGSYDEVVYCSVCGDEISRETKTIAKTAHTYKTTTTKATMTADGKKVQTCTICGVTKTATVIPKASGVKLSATKFVYNGKVQAPTLTVKDSNGNVIASKYYTVTWSNASSKAVGTYTVTITFKGNYSGTKTLTYTIVPNQVAGLKNSKAATTAITLSWSKATGAKYYEVYGSTDGKTFKKVATASTNSLKVTKIDGKALAAGKTYYFKVRALDSTKKLIGSFSSVLKTGTLTKAPTITALTSTKSKTATVTWGKVTGAKSYTVYTSTDGKTFKVYKSGMTGTSLSITKLTGGKKIYVKVTAVNSYGAESVASAVKSVKVKK